LPKVSPNKTHDLESRCLNGGGGGGVGVGPPSLSLISMQTLLSYIWLNHRHNQKKKHTEAAFVRTPTLHVESQISPPGGKIGVWYRIN